MEAQRRGNAQDSAAFNCDSSLKSAECLSVHWQELCRRYLPILPENSIWRYNRRRQPEDPEQGWKLHIAATILNAAVILESVAPFLESEGAIYKAPRTLQELKKLNSGIIYSYTQIGKFITVYPRTDEQAVHFAERLHQLTQRFSAPGIPYDLKFKPESCVHYRYGAFKVNEIKNADGTVELALRDRQGKLVSDLRDSEKPYPDWVLNPFPAVRETISVKDSPFQKKIRVFRALSQRGKGGVYQGLDLTVDAPRICLLKEGRKDGETDWDGRDGCWRVRHEERVLKSLRTAGVKVPQIYFSFQTAKNYYLVTEFITGENLHAFLKKKRRRLGIAQAIKYAIELSEIMSQIHAAGWLWRDCKPGNLIVTKNHGLRPLDFEGACSINQPDPVLWSTLALKSPEVYVKFFEQSTAAVDLFTLGAIIYLLFEGRLPEVTVDCVPEILRRNVPFEIKQLTSQLLKREAAELLSAEAVARKLKAVRKIVENSKSAK